MKTIHTIQQMQAEANQWRQQGLTIGFVPTMGFLHEGHCSLIREAAERTDRVVVSIFVNPTQFGEGEDLEAYPRDFARDCELCEANGAYAVFQPTPEEMYPANASTWVVEEHLSRPLCGATRPNHFRGVTTVVAKLFNAVHPHVALFGRKDAQQALIIQRMVRDLNMDVGIVVAPIVREADGLAMSSRNTYLTADERSRATAIHRALHEAAAAYAGGTRDAGKLTAGVRAGLEEADGRIDYVELRSRATLDETATIDEPVVLAVAAYFGKARLIDNLYLPEDAKTTE